jgi:hypothetical protein
VSTRGDFLQLVQAACIIQDTVAVLRGLTVHRDGLEVLARAQQIDEAFIPKYQALGDAAREYVVYAYARPTEAGPPAWYLEWLEAEGGEW